MEEAHRIMKPFLPRQRVEFHYTPNHGSWLNIVETELSVLTGQCLKRRLSSRASVRQEVAVWERHRHNAQATVQWRFTTTDAPTKLRGSSGATIDLFVPFL